MMKYIFMTLAFAALGLNAGELKIVDKGNIGSAVVVPSKWVKKQGALEVTGPDVFVASQYSLKPKKPFKIKAKLALEKLNGTAASLIINGNNIGFDGAEHQMFVDGPEFEPSKSIASNGMINADKPFILEVDSDGKMLSVKINSRFVFQQAFNPDNNIVVALRPHRAKMKIYDFSLEGETGPRNTVNDIAGERPPVGTDITAFSIAENAVVSYKMPDGKWTAELNLQGKVTPLNTTVKNENVFVAIPSEVLQQAYQAAASKYNLKRIAVTLHGSGNQAVEKYLLVYDPMQCLGFRQAKVKVVNGAPAILVNDHPEGIVRGRVSMLRNRYRSSDEIDFYRAGLRESLIWLHPRKFYNNGKFQQKLFNDYIEKTCLKIVRDAPDNSISMIWIFYTNKDWDNRHPGELIVTDPKVNNFRHAGCLQASYASPAWREYCTDILTGTLRSLQKSPLADRIISMKLGYGNCSEWNNFGYHEKVFPDLSAPMQKAFGSWLKNKYRTDDNLRKAWNRKDVTFASGTLVPGYKERMQNSDGVFRTYPNGRPASDYYEFWQEYTVDTIEFLAKKLKEITDGKILAGAYYGYFIGHISASPYHFQDSGHYALGRYLRSPYLDFVSAPYPYNNRLKNAPVNGAFSSVKLHGKIWESENDQRTHRSGQANLRYGTTGSLQESIAIAKRDFIQNLAKGCSYYFYDFIDGWYQDKEFMETVQTLKKIDDFALKNGRDSIAQIAVLLDEKVVPMISNHSQRAMDELSKMLVYNLDAAGAPWDCYLMSDLTQIDFSRYKLVIMANAYHMNQAERRAVKKYIYNHNRSVLFLYAPGIIDSNGKTDYKAAFELTGMKFVPGKNIAEMPFKPLWTAVKDGPKVIKSFRNGKPAVVVRKFPDYKIFFATAPGLNSSDLNKIYKQAGVHCYNAPGDNSLFACQNIIGIYSRNGGRKNIVLPSKVEVVYDFFQNKVIGRNTSSFSIDLPEQTSSIILYTGKEADIKAFAKNADASQASK